MYKIHDTFSVYQFAFRLYHMKREKSTLMYFDTKFLQFYHIILKMYIVFYHIKFM